MKLLLLWIASFLAAMSTVHAENRLLPDPIKKIMLLPKYDQAIWGLYVKDLETGKTLLDLNSPLLFSPASTTKLFSVAALLHTYGNDYRFKTPVFAKGKIDRGILNGDLILFAQGDLTFGGRQSGPDQLSYTVIDHTNANEVPGATLTSQNPLQALNSLADQIYQKGIREIQGEVQIDDTLFEITQKRGMMVTPIMINENLIDIVLNSTSVGLSSHLKWRPQVPGYEIINQVKTVSKEGPLHIEISSDEAGHRILVQGTIPLGQKNIVSTFSIKDPKQFARAAFTAALENRGIKVMGNPSKDAQGLQELAVWVSPPLQEYAKLILKVSHNLGANLVPLLLAVEKHKKTYDEGMQILGEFLIEEVKLNPHTFVLVDAAGGNDNRLTPQTEVQLLEYISKADFAKFPGFLTDLPILGVDGSMADFGKTTPAVGKIYTKPGTGVVYNLATQKLFLTTQALAGYIKGKKGHLLAFMLAVNNGQSPTIEDIFPIFEDVSQIAAFIYEEF